MIIDSALLCPQCLPEYWWGGTPPHFVSSVRHLVLHATKRSRIWVALRTHGKDSLAPPLLNLWHIPWRRNGGTNECFSHCTSEIVTREKKRTRATLLIVWESRSKGARKREGVWSPAAKQNQPKGRPRSVLLHQWGREHTRLFELPNEEPETMDDNNNDNKKKENLCHHRVMDRSRNQHATLLGTKPQRIQDSLFNGTPQGTTRKRPRPVRQHSSFWLSHSMIVRTIALVTRIESGILPWLHSCGRWWWNPWCRRRRRPVSPHRASWRRTRLVVLWFAAILLLALSTATVTASTDPTSSSWHGRTDWMHHRFGTTAFVMVPPDSRIRRRARNQPRSIQLASSNQQSSISSGSTSRRKKKNQGTDPIYTTNKDQGETSKTRRSIPTTATTQQRLTTPKSVRSWQPIPHQDTTTQPEQEQEQQQVLHTTLRHLQSQLPHVLHYPWTLDQVLQTHVPESSRLLVLTTTATEPSAAPPPPRTTSRSGPTSYSSVSSSSSDSIVCARTAQELVQWQNALWTYTTLVYNTWMGIAGLSQPQQEAKSSYSLPLLDCQITLVVSNNNDNTTSSSSSPTTIQGIQVDWSVPLLTMTSLLSTNSGARRSLFPFGMRNDKDNDDPTSSSPPNNRGILRGRSWLLLEDGKVARHEVQSIQWKASSDDEGTFQTLNVAAVGQFLQQLQQWGTVLRGGSGTTMIPSTLFSFVPPPDTAMTTTTTTTVLTPPPEWLKEVVPALLSPSTTTARNVLNRLLLGPQAASTSTSSSTVPPLRDPNKTSTTPSPEPLWAVRQSRKPSNVTTSGPILLDDTWTAWNLSVPLPGSKQWMDHVAVQQVIHVFVQDVIPQLVDPRTAVSSSSSSSSTSSMTWKFARQATLVATDGHTILVPTTTERNTGESTSPTSRHALLDFFASLATLRRRSRGTWTLQSTEQTVPLILSTSTKNDDPLVTTQVRVHYQAQGPLENAVISGTDVYTLQIRLCESTTQRSFQILQIEQERLDIAGNSNPRDTTLSMQRFVAALTNSNTQALLRTADDSWLVQLWQRLIMVDATAPNSPTRTGTGSLPALNQAEARSDEAAATVYRLMVALHTQGQALGSTSSTVSPQLPGDPTSRIPALEFMAESLELVGYLGESLVRGKTPYAQVVGFWIGQLQSNLQSGRLIFEASPSKADKVDQSPAQEQQPVTTRVEWTDRGTIRYRLILNLRVVLTPPGLPPPPSWLGTPLPFGTMNQDSTSNPSSSSFPLQLALQSEFVLDSESGTIVQQRLVDTYINGQLTPADVVSQWFQAFQQQQRGGSSSGNNNNMNNLWSLLQLVAPSSSSSSSSTPNTVPNALWQWWMQQQQPPPPPPSFW